MKRILAVGEAFFDRPVGGTGPGRPRRGLLLLLDDIVPQFGQMKPSRRAPR